MNFIFLIVSLGLLLTHCTATVTTIIIILLTLPAGVGGHYWSCHSYRYHHCNCLLMPRPRNDENLQGWSEWNSAPATSDSDLLQWDSLIVERENKHSPSTHPLMFLPILLLLLAEQSINRYIFCLSVSNYVYFSSLFLTSLLHIFI